jgi:hypothetical protein
VKLNIPFSEAPVHHYPRVHGKATGANLRVIAHAFHELLRLHPQLRNWHAEIPPEE